MPHAQMLHVSEQCTLISFSKLMPVPLMSIKETMLFMLETLNVSLPLSD